MSFISLKKKHHPVNVSSFDFKIDKFERFSNLNFEELAINISEYYFNRSHFATLLNALVRYFEYSFHKIEIVNLKLWPGHYANNNSRQFLIALVNKAISNEEIDFNLICDIKIGRFKYQAKSFQQLKQ